MSLKALSEYLSDSDSDDIDAPCVTKLLPKPVFTDNIPVFSKENHNDDKDKHAGRVRNFPHERGNWASSVFLPVSTISKLPDLIKVIERDIYLHSKLETITDLHISLSKTFILKYHWLESFADTLKENLKDCPSLTISIDKLKIYCNDQKNRTFIALCVTSFDDSKLKQVVEKIDKALVEFDLPTYYEKPSFHISILWLLGDQRGILNKHENTLNKLFYEIFKGVTLSFRDIHLKTGNKIFQFPLKS